MFEPCVIVAYKSLSCPQCEKIVIVGKGSNKQKCWKTKDFVGPEIFFSKEQLNYFTVHSWSFVGIVHVC